jgi:hypothetical protein
MYEFDLNAHAYDSLLRAFNAVDESARNDYRVDKKVYYRSVKAPKGKLAEMLCSSDLPNIVAAVINGPIMHMQAFRSMKTQVRGKVDLKELFRFAFCRIDQDDGQAYTQQEFANYYGAAGKTKWENALRVCSQRSLGVVDT